jgi:sugar lactone lactonase YvrE
MKRLFSACLALLFLNMNGQKIYTVAGNGGNGSGPDGVSAISSSFGLIESSIALDAPGNIYIADWSNHRIRKVDFSTGIITTIAGTGTPGYNGDGIPATSAQISYPGGVAVDKQGNVYIGEYSGYRIRKIAAGSGLISTICGNGTWGYNGDSIPAAAAIIREVSGITTDTAGNVYFSDLGNAMVRKIDISTGIIMTLAGTGVSGYNGDSARVDTAQLNFPYGLAVDVSGNFVYVADKGNLRVRKVDINAGYIYDIAGTGVLGYNGDGISADTAQLKDPWSVAVDNNNNIYIAESGSDRLRKIDASGIIHTICGNGSNIFSGDGGLATLATICGPRGVCVDDCGHIYITDRGNFRIRRITSYDVSVAAANAKCFGSCDGTVNVLATGGAGSYTYMWDGGLGAGASHTNVCAGTYRVIVNDAANCKEDVYLTVSEPSALSIGFTTTNATCFGNGSASANVSGGTMPYSYSWSGGQTTASIAGLSAGTYSLTVTDANSCVSTQTVSISNNPTPFASAPICMVTVDSASQYNIITWDKTSFTNVDSFVVLREIATNNYQPIASLPYSALSQFVDTVRTKYFPNTGDPNAGTYRYKLKMIDSCGNASLLSSYHNTIYMLNSSGTFYWNQLYSIENAANPVSSYVLLRDNNSNGNWQVVNSVAGTQQLVTDPLYSIYQNTASWRVQTQWNISCTPSFKAGQSQSSFNSSYSNVYTNVGIGIHNSGPRNLIRIYPSPNSGSFTVETSDLNVHLEIYNVLGDQVFVQPLSQGKNAVETNLCNGTYLGRIVSDKGVVIEKIIIHH